MSNIHDYKGICENRTFIDAYYLFLKAQKELSEGDFKNDSKENLERDVVNSFLAIIGECIKKIGEENDPNVKLDYLDWLRWNKLIIRNQFETLAGIENDNLKEIIKELKDKFEETLNCFFNLSNEEMAVLNQYIHAFERIKRKTTTSENVYRLNLQHAARLIINLFNYLKNRFYIYDTSSIGMNYDEIESQAQFLISESGKIFDQIGTDVKEAADLYKEFCNIDNAKQNLLDQQMELALESAHMRAHENWLQTSIRMINESIESLKRSAAKKIKDAWESPILTPFKNPKLILEFFKSPLKSTKEALTWAKENPWKSAPLILGGFVVGLITVGCPVVGFAIAADAVVSSVTLSVPVLAGIGLG